jgi:aspartyl-tRNA(Asn)/glutamyl-tRNA(Gln) amidotransferase subunit B
MRDPDRAYEPVIGLEIHVQLSTRTKMFCGCELSFGEEPNTRTCPICLGHPGVLPVINAEAVHFALMIGMALDCEIAERSIFHRKQYFYPDNPKAYQISQYDIPICGAGRLGDVRIHRAHLEEDAAKLVHAGASGRIHSAESSIVDFNRGGTPLVEIVTEPDLHDPKEAGEWLRLLRATLKRLGVSDVNMDEGSLRCDANVSLRHAGSAVLGTKTELKNMNSFRFLERGIEAELKRQEEILRAGGQVEQETLHFDPQSGALSTLRSKEEAHDYRYFPEPDLVPVVPTKEMLERARAALPELPAARAERFESELSLPADTAKLLAFRSELGDLYEDALASGNGVDPRALANWVTQESAAADVEPGALAKLVSMVSEKTVSASAAREVLGVLASEGGDPAQIVEQRGLGAQGADELGDIVNKAIAENADAVEKIKAGKGQAIGAIVGAVMKETRGRADGGEVQKLIREQLGLSNLP